MTVQIIQCFYTRSYNYEVRGLGQKQRFSGISHNYRASLFMWGSGPCDQSEVQRHIRAADAPSSACIRKSHAMKRLVCAALALTIIGSTAAVADPYGRGNSRGDYSRQDRGNYHHDDNGAGLALGLGIGLFALAAIASQHHDRDYDRYDNLGYGGNGYYNQSGYGSSYGGRSNYYQGGYANRSGNNDYNRSGYGNRGGYSDYASDDYNHSAYTNYRGR
jgi:hypothetical protein